MTCMEEGTVDMCGDPWGVKDDFIMFHTYSCLYHSFRE